MLLVVCALSAAPPINIIFDTDMHTDCDDAGALAVLHALAGEGLAHIVGVVHTAPAPFGPMCADAINTYYGRGDIPVGGMVWPEYPASPRFEHYAAAAKSVEQTGADYVETIARNFPRTQTKEGRPVPESVTQYRRLLANAADGSIVICAVGQLAGLAGLLDSGSDTISPLSGAELARQKVRLLVTMALGAWPEGHDTFNWICDIPSAARVLNAWPGPMAVMPHGENILTGGRLVAEGPKDSPVRRIYEIYVKRDDHLRPSWDLCAAYYAVKGPGALFRARSGRRLRFDATTGRHEWIPGPDSQHIYVERVATPETIAAAVEELLCRRPVSASKSARTNP